MEPHKLNKSDMHYYNIIIEVRYYEDKIGYIMYNYEEDYITYKYSNESGRQYIIDRPPILINEDGSYGLNSLYNFAIEETYPVQRPYLMDFCKFNGLDYYDPLILLSKTKGKRLTNRMTYEFIKFDFKENPLYPKNKLR